MLTQCVLMLFRPVTSMQYPKPQGEAFAFASTADKWLLGFCDSVFPRLLLLLCNFLEGSQRVSEDGNWWLLAVGLEVYRRLSFSSGRGRLSDDELLLCNQICM